MNYSRWHCVRNFLREHSDELTILLTVLGIVVSCIVSVTLTYWEIRADNPAIQPLAGVGQAVHRTVVSVAARLSSPPVLVVLAIAIVIIVVSYVIWRFRRRELIGRDREIKKFHDMLRRKAKERILAIHGESGVGKSLLVDVLIRMCNKERVAWARIDFRESSAGHVDILDNLVNQLGKENFAGYVQSRSEYNSEMERLRTWEYLPQVRERLRQMESELTEQFTLCLTQIVRTRSTVLRRRPVVLLFDTIERIAGTDIDDWLCDTFLTETEGGLKELVLVIAGQKKLSWEDEWQHAVASYELERFSAGLTEECIKRVLGKAVAGLVQMIYKLTEGHPLCVGACINKISRHTGEQREKILNGMLVERGASFDAKVVMRLSIEKILEQLDQEGEQDVADAIRYCAVPRWFDANTIRAISGKDIYESQRILNKLVKYAFVRPRPLGGYIYHEIAREVLVDKWLQDDVTGYGKLNERMVELCDERLERARGDEWRQWALEKLYHQLTVDEGTGVVLLRDMFEEARELFRLDFCLALLGEVKDHPLKEETSKGWATYYLGELAYARGEWQAAERIYRELLKSDVAPLLKAYIASSLGTLCYYRGEIVDSRKMYEQSLDIQREFGDESKVADILFQLGKTYVAQCDWERALKYFNESLASFREQGNIFKVGRIRSSMGTIYLSQGLWDEAIRYYNDCLEICQDLQDEYGRGRVLYWLAWAYQLKGKWNEAVSLNHQSLTIMRRMGHEYRIARILINLGDVYRLLGNLDGAMDCYNECMEICERQKNKFAIGVLLGNWGRVFYDQGKWEEAFDYYTRSIEIRQEVGYSYGIGATLNDLGDLCSSQGKWDKAIEYYARALEIARGNSDRYLEVMALVGLSSSRYAKNDLNEALGLMKDAQQVAEEYGFFDQLARLQCVQGKMSIDEHQYQEAFALYAQACSNALKYNRYLLRQIVNAIGIDVHRLASTDRRSALDLCTYLSDFWGSREQPEAFREFACHFREIKEHLSRQAGGGSQ